jgi:hypothetical protein
MAGRFFRGELEVKFLNLRITEVTVISNFITNIIRFSETANLFDSNFTVKGVVLRKMAVFLNVFYLEKDKNNTISNNMAKKLEIFFLRAFILAFTAENCLFWVFPVKYTLDYFILIHYNIPRHNKHPRYPAIISFSSPIYQIKRC